MVLPRMSADKISLGTERILRLLHLLGSPHHRFPVIHVAGTNGKGSVCAYLDSILLSSRFRTGRFNSPHLVEPRDSIRTNGEVVGHALFREAKRRVEAMNASQQLQASPFELLTATALVCFSLASSAPDVLVIEVGMGGLRDATNVFPASLVLASVITSISLDHQTFLGSDLVSIAKEKAGIIKQGGLCVVAQQSDLEAEEAIRAVAVAKQANLVVAMPAQRLPGERGRVELVLPKPSPSTPPAETPPLNAAAEATLPLHGDYQALNASLAACTVSLLRPPFASPHSSTPSPPAPHPTAYDPAHLTSIRSRLSKVSDEDIVKGIERTRWEGRLDWVELPLPLSVSQSSSPSRRDRRHISLLVDGAHNPAAAAALRSYVDGFLLSSLHGKTGRKSLDRHRQLTWIVGFSAGKDVREMLELLLLGSSSSQAGLVKEGNKVEGEEEGTTAKRTPRRLPGGASRVRLAAVPFTTPIEGMPWVKPVPPMDVLAAAREVLSLPSSSSSSSAPSPSSREDGLGDDLAAFDTLEEALSWAVSPPSFSRSQMDDGVDSTTEKAAEEPDRVEEDGLLVLCGSLYLVADIYRLQRQMQL